MKNTFLIIVIFISSFIIFTNTIFNESSQSQKINLKTGYDKIEIPLKDLKGIEFDIADVDADGNEDFIVSGVNKKYKVSEVKLILNKNNFPQLRIFRGKNIGGELLVDDFNMDGCVDVISHEANRSGYYSLLHLLVGDCKGNFSLRKTYRFNYVDILSLSHILFNNKTRLIIGGDILDDEKIKAVIFELDLENNNIKLIWKYNHTGNSTVLGLVSGDLNGDNIEDIAAIVNNDKQKIGEVLYLLADENGNFDPLIAFANKGYIYLISDGDFNEDNITDIFIDDISGKFYGKLIILLNGKGGNLLIREFKLSEGNFIDSLSGTSEGTLFLGISSFPGPLRLIKILSKLAERPKTVSEFNNAKIISIKKLKYGNMNFVSLIQYLNENNCAIIIFKSKNNSKY